MVAGKAAGSLLEIQGNSKVERLLAVLFVAEHVINCTGLSVDKKKALIRREFGVHPPVPSFDLSVKYFGEIITFDGAQRALFQQYCMGGLCDQNA